MSSMACISEPISWLRLETYAQRGDDAAVREHVERCPACRGCLAEIRDDVVALPALPVVAAKARRTWWTWGVPAFAAAAAAILFVVWPRPEPPPARDDIATVKGIGEVV